MPIPVPAGTAAPCDFDTDWCATTTAIQEKVTGYRNALARLVPATPIAVLRLSERINPMPPLNPIPFTEVVIDTAGMTDLDADPSSIHVRRSGRYTLRGWFRMNTTGAVNTIITVRVASDIPGIEVNGVILDRAIPGSSLGAGAYESVITVAAGTRIQLLQATSGGLDIELASLSVAWHSDTVRPV